METVIGVFASRERAEETLKELLEKQVPQEAIVFLTRSESEAMSLGKTLGAIVGGFVGGGAGVTAGVVAATMFSIPGIGQVFALGAGATAALGLAGAAVGKALAAKPDLSLERAMETPQPTPGEESSEDLALLGEVLKEGRSVILVRNDLQEIATLASAVLDRMGISATWRLTDGRGRRRIRSRCAGQDHRGRGQHHASPGGCQPVGEGQQKDPTEPAWSRIHRQLGAWRVGQDAYNTRKTRRRDEDDQP
jgi:hypothetical protein